MRLFFLCILIIILVNLSGCVHFDNVQPCFTVGAPGSTLNQVGIKVNHSDKAMTCSGDLSTDLLEPPFPFNDNSTIPTVELPYNR